MDLIEELEKGRYGSLELNRLVGPNLMRGLIISLVLHSVAIASPFIINFLKGEEEIPERVIVLDPSQLTQLKRNREDSPETVQIARPKVAPPKAAIPVAVEEEQVVEELMPTTAEIAEYFDSGEDEALDIQPGDEVVIQEEEKDPEEGVFTPREFDPKALEGNPVPAYPELAKTAGVTCRVTANILVGKNGEVKRYKIVKVSTPGLGFEEEVEKVIMKWKFTPAIQQGHPIAVWVAYPFNFKLK